MSNAALQSNHNRIDWWKISRRTLRIRWRIRLKVFVRRFYWSSISNLGYTRGITQKLRATSGEDHLRNLARERLCFELRRNVASHWRWPWTALYSIWQVEYRTPDLWLWKQYRYCYTNQPITNPSCGRTCKLLANSRGNSSMSNFTFCILYRKILVFAYIPSIVSCISYLVKQIWTCCWCAAGTPWWQKLRCRYIAIKKLSSTDL